MNGAQKQAAGVGKLVEALAEVCHEVNRAYCSQALGDLTQVPWAEAPDWQKESCKKGVFALITSDLTPEQQHGLWMNEKLRTGWRFGEAKDAEQKTHPAMLPYDQLPQDQKVKDYLFAAVVNTIKRQNT